MAILAQHLVLGKKQTLNGTHKRTALTGQVGSGLAWESGLEHVARTDSDADSQRTLQSFARSILIHSV